MCVMVANDITCCMIRYGTTFTDLLQDLKREESDEHAAFISLISKLLM